MRSNVSDVLPPAVKRSLTKFGSDLATARRKRGLTILAVAERMGVAKNTYLRAEKGDPKVGLGVYAMALFVLGFGEPLGALIDVSCDDTDVAKSAAGVVFKGMNRGAARNRCCAGDGCLGLLENRRLRCARQRTESGIGCNGQH